MTNPANEQSAQVLTRTAKSRLRTAISENITRQQLELFFRTHGGRDFMLGVSIMPEDSTPLSPGAESLLEKRADELIAVVESGGWRKYLPEPKCCKVYFVLDAEQKAVKIGFSKNVDARFQSLQHGNPNPS